MLDLIDHKIRGFRSVPVLRELSGNSQKWFGVIARDVRTPLNLAVRISRPKLPHRLLRSAHAPTT
jgi:hypothetical protein